MTDTRRMDINKSMCLTSQFGRMRCVPYDLVESLRRSTEIKVAFERSLNRYLERQQRRV